MPSARRTRAPRKTVEVFALRVIKEEGTRQPVQHRRRRTTDGTALETGVVLDAHAGQGCDLASPQPRHATLARPWQADSFRLDPGAT